MSFLKTIKTQLGISNTPANNFVLDASAADGTMKVSRGNIEGTTQDVITVDAAGKVAFPQNTQTWQDLTSSRTLAGVYTNNTGQPIQISVTIANAGSTGAFGAVLNVKGVTIISQYVMQSIGANNFFLSFVLTIPNGDYYSFGSGVSCTLTKWMELR